MRRCSLVLLGAGAALAALAALAAFVGLAPVAASAGHWKITDWLLHSTMRHTVRVRSLQHEPPALSAPALVLRGAGHYDSGCAPCHGAPGVHPSKVTQRMTPHPPVLTTRIPKWKPRELFWIVKNGVKFTGMPAWVAPTRDDEVWAMVAFLVRMPGMTPEEYRRLSQGESARDSVGSAGRRAEALQEPLESALAVCARCHGRDGAGRGEGAFPRLAGQREEYLLAALQAYADGKRFSGIMQPQAAGLDDAMRRVLARHYASRRTAAMLPEVPIDPDARRRGERIALDGAGRQGVPACSQCHGPAEAPRNPHFPVLAGQYLAYLELQLELFQKGARGGSPFAAIMDTAAHRLTPEQIRDVASFYAALDPADDGRAGGRQ